MTGFDDLLDPSAGQRRATVAQRQLLEVLRSQVRLGRGEISVAGWDGTRGAGGRAVDDATLRTLSELLVGLGRLGLVRWQRTRSTRLDWIAGGTCLVAFALTAGGFGGFVTVGLVVAGLAAGTTTVVRLAGVLLDGRRRHRCVAVTGALRRGRPGPVIDAWITSVRVRLDRESQRAQRFGHPLLAGRLDLERARAGELVRLAGQVESDELAWLLQRDWPAPTSLNRLTVRREVAAAGVAWLVGLPLSAESALVAALRRYERRALRLVPLMAAGASGGDHSDDR